MARMPEMKVEVTRFCIVLFPVATYLRCGELEILTVFAVPVYKRAGSVKSLFGIVWGNNEPA